MQQGPAAADREGVNTLRIHLGLILVAAAVALPGCGKLFGGFAEASHLAAEGERYVFGSDPQRTWDVTREVLAEHGFRCDGPLPIHARARCEGPEIAGEFVVTQVRIAMLDDDRHNLEIYEFREDADPDDGHTVDEAWTKPARFGQRVWEVVVRIDPEHAREVEQAAQQSREDGERAGRKFSKWLAEQDGYVCEDAE